MTKKMIPIVVLMLALVLSACGENATPSAAAANELPVQVRLAIGTLKLEETDFAVTKEQTKALLPLWHVLKDLNESDTAAQQEIEGLVNQISETMSEEQIKAIGEMNLTRRDMASLMQGNGNGRTNSATSDSNNNGSSMGGGPPPDMGGGMPGMGAPAGSTNTNARQFPMAQTSSAPSALIEMVVTLLKKKAGL